MCEPDAFGDEPNRIVRQYHHLIRPRGLVLNLGAGGGRDTVFLTNRGCRVHSVDNSAESVSHARGRLAQEGVSADVECVDVREFALADGAADGVVMIGVHGLGRSEYEALFRHI